MNYPGSKNGSGVCQQIINLMPPHDVYIEPFLGSGAVLRQKLPARLSIGLDLDPAAVEKVRSTIAGFDGAAASLELQVVDGIAFLQSYQWRGGELVYLDPPYPFEVRDNPRPIYAHEMTVDEHIKLLELIKGLPCKVIISSYYSELYARALEGWDTHSFKTIKRSGAPAIEWLWFNYARPVELHDYRFLGKNFREREQIKRQRERWKARLERMPPLKRYALLAAMREFSRPTPSELTMRPGASPEIASIEHLRK